MFYRNPVIDGGLTRTSRNGDSINTNLVLGTDTTDSNHTLDFTQLAGGAVQFSGQTAGRSITTPTAVNLLTLYPAMDIGDSFDFFISNLPAFALTWVAGAGVTLAGRATSPASTSTRVMVIRTGAAAVTWNVF